MKHYHVTLEWRKADDAEYVLTVGHTVQALSAKDAIAATEAWSREQVTLALGDEHYVAASKVHEFTPKP